MDEIDSISLNINFSSFWMYISILLTALSVKVWTLLMKYVRIRKEQSELFQCFFISILVSLGEFFTYYKFLKDQPHKPIWGFIPSIVVPLILFYASIVSCIFSIFKSIFSGFFSSQFFQDFIGVNFYIVLIYLSFALANSSLIGILFSILQLISAIIKTNSIVKKDIPDYKKNI